MPHRRSLSLLAAAIAGALGCAGAPSAKTLLVGPEQDLKVPSAAAAIAADGDLVAIDPGEYFDCAVWKANRLAIIGVGADVVITDTTCEGKALFITRGDDITIRNLTFTRARVADQNGAGIRAEGKNLTIDESRFVNNENGILTIAESPGSTITIIDSEFVANGKCASACAHGLNVGHVALLHVERSKFLGTKAGHDIETLAERTELVDNEIADGPDGTSSFLVDAPDGGALVMEGNRLEKGPKTANPAAAIMVGGGEPVRPGTLRFVNNAFTNDTGKHTAFVLNWTDRDARFADNVLRGDIVEESSDGAFVHRIRATLGGWRNALVDTLKGVARRLRDR